VKTKLRTVGCLALVAVIAWRLDWHRFRDAFARLDPLPWSFAVGLYVAAQVVSGERWRLLARPLGFGGSTVRYVAYYFVGMFFNLALPSSVGGDVARSLYLAGQEGRAKGPRRLEAFLTVLAERLSGVLMLAALACAAAPFCPVPLPDRVWVGVAVVGAGALVGVGLFLLLPIADSLVNPQSAIRNAQSAGCGLRARLTAVAVVYRRRPWLLAGTALLSLAVQALNVAVVAACGAALGLSVPPLYYAVIVPLVTLLTLLPVSINGMGLRELGYTLFLVPLGVEPAEAVGLGLLAFAATALPALGGAFVMTFGLQKRDAALFRGEQELRPLFEVADDEPVGGDPDQGRARQPPTAA
jgi:uncharacterized membrane protein YbhN (UPF0104 family)